MIVVDGVARRIDFDWSPKDSSEHDFDLLESSYDNAGNFVHAEAPFSLWDDGAGALVDGREFRRRTRGSFDDTVDFANRHATHFVLSAANFFQFEGESQARRDSYTRLMRSLDRLNVPLVVMGIGVQAQNYWNPRTHRLPIEAIELMQFMGAKCSSIGVRGEFSASIFRDYAGVRNTNVIGCPSFFQRPEAFAELRIFLAGHRGGSVAFSPTHLYKPAEMQIVRRSIEESAFWVEVTHEYIHRLAIDPELDTETNEVPESIRELIRGTSSSFGRSGLVDYFSRRYRRFRDFSSWWQFSREQVRFSYGTRFHGNMATLLAGRPALWITHDFRTTELTKTLHLPSVTLPEAVEIGTEELEASVNYESMFDHLPVLFDRFNGFLDENGLPQARHPFRSN